MEEAHVVELTGLLRKGPGGDRLKAWPKSMRVFARRERPHPGAAHPVRGRRRVALHPVGGAFAAASEKTDTALGLYNAVVDEYPDRLNRGVLWNSARAVKA